MSEGEKTTCCDMRRKVALFLGPVLPEQVCGVPDSVLADFVRFIDHPVKDASGQPRPVIQLRFCPWCGKPFTDASEIRITNLVVEEPESESGEEWKVHE